ncbi:MAG TPA: dihydrofolate reductase family protein [Candidatus Saccharimonadales bacterium]|nr:dihydrofolate reductase family protein [Candidatus Saccharimonadales bacterium]
MRKIIVSNIVSLDGFYEGPGKNVMVLPMDGSFDTQNLECMKNADVVLLGGNSYKFFGAFWPMMENNQETSETNREFSRRYNKIQKVAISNSLTLDDAPEAWKTTTRIISENVYEELAKLKDEDGKDIVMYASRMLWNDLMQHGLVDELHFVVGNVVLGDGTPIFEKTISYDDPNVKLELLDTKKGEGSNNNLVKYKVVYKD